MVLTMVFLPPKAQGCRSPFPMKKNGISKRLDQQCPFYMTFFPGCRMSP
jgi:hypothetical protein